MFRLIPFSPQKDAPELRGDIRIQGNELQLEFHLHDPKKEVLNSLAPRTEAGERADNLWQTTCFEAFFSEAGKPGYWELNLSPWEAKWNLYYFDSYRNPSNPQPSFDFEIKEILVTESSLSCRLNSSTPRGPLDANLCAVFCTKNATLFYSLKHAGREPDFHLRESMAIRLGRN